MKPIHFRINAQQFEALHAHLFPGDGDEHGAVLLAGIAESDREISFTVREVLLAKDGTDYVAGRRGYRMLTADFVAKASDKAAKEKLCYFAVHCHGGTDRVEFSGDDFASHQRGYPALLDITNGGPVGALVFARNAVAGSIWSRSGVTPIESMTTVGLNLGQLFAAPPSPISSCSEIYDRQALIFGARGQQRLARLKVGIIGLGGVGSLVNELLARVGVGEIVAIDPELIETSNRSRIVGSTVWDSQDRLLASKWRFLQAIGRKLVKSKVEIAERVARQANRSIKFHPIRGNIVDRTVAHRLKHMDYLFLCADSMQARLVFNALVHQYLIPGVQIGSKVMLNDHGDIGDVFSVARMVLPYQGGGCLICNQLINFSKLQDEAISEEERQRQDYVKGVPAPSVITLNGMGATQAVNDFLFCVQGLFNRNAQAGYRQHFARERQWTKVELAKNETCPHCGLHSKSVFGRADRAELPCR